MTQVLETFVTPVEPPTGVAKRREHIGPAAFAMAVVSLAVLFLVAVAPRVSLPPGDSHDGRNAGLWSVGARSLLENGPIESRLGADAPERGVYANHPPGVTWETAVFLATTGDGPWSRKAPAYLSSVAAIGLGAVLMRRLRYSRAAALAGVALMTTTPMFLVFGASPNMEAVSLPWVLLVLIAWADPTHRFAPGAAALGVVGCVWTYHASLLLAVLVGAIALLRIVRGRETPIDRPTVGWALPAGLLLGGWFAWANGGLSGLLGQGGQRSSIGAVGAGGWFGRQATVVGDVFGWPLLLLAFFGIVVGLRTATGDRRTALALGVATPMIYLLVTADGAWHHEYWNYLVVVSIALGVSAGTDVVLSRGSVVSRGALGVTVALLMIVGLTARIPAHSLFVDGADAAELLDRVALPTTQETALTYPLVVGPLSWVEWATRLPSENLDGPGPLRAWAAVHPDDEILVERDGVLFLHGDHMWDLIQERAGDAVEGQYALIAADELAALAQDEGLDPNLPDRVLEDLERLSDGGG